MAAHVRQIVFACTYGECPKLATHAVYNAVNAPMGRYCEKHAKVTLIRFVNDHPGQG